MPGNSVSVVGGRSLGTVSLLRICPTDWPSNTGNSVYTRPFTALRNSTKAEEVTEGHTSAQEIQKGPLLGRGLGA